MTTLNLDVLWRDRGATRGLKGIGDETDKAARHMQRFKVAAGVAAVAVGAAVLKFGKDSVKAYAEAQTSQARLQDAFQKFPRLADTNIGALRNLNTELAKKTRFDDDATASGQAVLAQFKLTGQQITQLTPLLQDYAAKTGRDLPQAASLLGKAMLGNGRALKEVGINFKDTGDQGKNFDQIMSGLRTQVGGFAEKEGKTAAGQVEILKNQFGELQEEAGSHLVPALTKVVGVATKAVTAFGELGPTAKTTVGALAVGIPTFTLAAIGIGKIVSVSKAAKTALVGMSAAARTASVATAGIGIAVGVATLAWVNYAQKQAEAKQETEDLTDALVLSNGAINESIRAGKAKSLQQSGAADQAQELGVSLELLTAAHLGEADAIAEVNTILDSHISRQAEASAMGARMSTSQAEQSKAARKLKEDLAAGNITLEEARRRAKELGTATTGAADAQTGFKDATQRSREELARWRADMFKSARAALGLAGSEDDLEAAVDDATASVKENGRTLNNNTEKGRANRTALRNLALASLAYREQLIEQNAKQGKVTETTEKSRKKFIDTAIKMGATREEARKLADTYGLLDRKINALNSKTIRLTTNYRATAAASFAKFIENVPAGPNRSGFSQLPRGGPAKARSLDSMIGAPASPPVGFAQGGPSLTSIRHSSPGLSNALGDPAQFRDTAFTAGRYISRKSSEWLGKKGTDYVNGLMTAPGAPSGSVGTYSAGMAATIARLRAAGARSFTTYPGHHPSAAKARDVTPHNWRIANTARASSGVWYVIYQMRIASKNHGNTWRQYNPTNHNGDWQHRRHVHVAWFDSGGTLKPGLNLAYNGTGKNERLVPAAPNSGGGNTTIIINAPHWVGDTEELRRTLVDMNRRGQLEVIKR